jgi:RES domain-containing protein
MTLLDGNQTSRRTVRGIAFRACSPDNIDLAATAASSREDPGRFNTATVGAVYVSREADTAMDELRRTTELEGKSLADAHPCAILAVELDLAAIVDLTTRDAMDAWDLNENDLSSEDMRRCQTAAQRIARAGAEGVRWPSAAGSGQSLAIFIEQLQPRSRAVIMRTFPLSWEMLRSIDTGTSTSHIIQELSELPLIARR